MRRGRPYCEATQTLIASGMLPEEAIREAGRRRMHDHYHLHGRSASSLQNKARRRIYHCEWARAKRQYAKTWAMLRQDAQWERIAKAAMERWGR